MNVTEDQLIDVYLDGMMTGLATGLEAVASSIPESDRDAMAAGMMEAIKRDPAATLTLRNEIDERLAGVNTGEKNLTVSLAPRPRA